VVIEVVETMYSNQELNDMHLTYGLAEGNAVIDRRLYQEGIQDEEDQVGKHL
jgi:hypothetical protein